MCAVHVGEHLCHPAAGVPAERRVRALHPAAQEDLNFLSRYPLDATQRAAREGQTAKAAGDVPYRVNHGRLGEQLGDGALEASEALWIPTELGHFEMPAAA